MMTRRMVLAAVASSLFALTAQAGDYGRYCGYDRYPADLTSLYRGGQIQAPPYFSVHPPVYYSRPVPRTYGYSPWAYPPETITPQVPQRIGAVVVNPYVSQEAPGVATVVSRVKNSHVTVAE